MAESKNGLAVLGESFVRLTHSRPHVENYPPGNLKTMEKFQVAYFNEQGVDLIVIFLNESFGRKTQHEQSEIVDALQLCATAAGLQGTVVPIWSVGNSYRFIAPPNWHAFFKSPNIYPTLVANINRELTCG